MTNDDEGSQDVAALSDGKTIKTGSRHWRRKQRGFSISNWAIEQLSNWVVVDLLNTTGDAEERKRRIKT
jgi:hypothetical protein